MLLIALSWTAACGRVDYDDEDRVRPLLDPGVLTDAPYGIAPRVDGPGVAIAYPVFPVGGAAQLMLALTEADGVLADEPVALVPLDSQLDLLYLFAEADGYRIFHTPAGTGTVVVTGTDDKRVVTSTMSFTGRRHFSVTATATGYAAAYKTGGAPTQVVYERLDAEGVPVPGGPYAVEPTTFGQDFPRIAAYGDGGLALLWRDARSGLDQARLATVSSDLVTALPSIVAVETVDPQKSEALIEDGAGGVVAAIATRASPRTTILVRIGADGSATWATPPSLPPNRRESQDLSIHRDGNRVGVAWQTDQAALPQIDFAVVDLEQGTLGPVQRLSEGLGECAFPATTSLKERFVTVFESPSAESNGPFLRWSEP